MKIIIAGSGEVGFHLAELLSLESLDITLIDLNKDKLNHAENQLDIKVIKGNSYSYSVLNRANISNSDLFIAVTEMQSVNLTSCFLAKQLGAKKTIARISNTEFIEKNGVDISGLGIEELISPESLAADEISLVVSQSIFVLLILVLIRQGNYMLNGLPLLFLLYYYNGVQYKNELSNLNTDD